MVIVLFHSQFVYINLTGLRAHRKSLRWFLEFATTYLFNIKLISLPANAFSNCSLNLLSFVVSEEI